MGRPTSERPNGDWRQGENHHSIRWEEISVVDRARRQGELLLKEALHIQMTPAEDHFNCDGGVELPGCWIATIHWGRGWFMPTYDLQYR